MKWDVPRLMPMGGQYGIRQTVCDTGATVGGQSCWSGTSPGMGCLTGSNAYGVCGTGSGFSQGCQTGSDCNTGGSPVSSGVE